MDTQDAGREPTTLEQRVRPALDALEAHLGPRAARSAASTRARPEPPAPLMSAFQVDRDRILHTKAFRRLKHKTQVFIAPLEDHYVTRLTHTLEVAQVARTITRALRLNEDLAEAAALGHDIGHGPFGHAGEEALAECLPEGFRHNYHSVRVLDQLEGDGHGLNLTRETLDAIQKSSKAREDILAEGWGVPATLEGQIVKIADAVAYISHDVDDAVRAGVLAETDLPDRVRRVLGPTARERLASLTADIVDASWDAANDPDSGHPAPIRFSHEVAAVANELREFLFRRVYHYDATLEAAARGKRIVVFLFRHFVGHPGAISSGFSLPHDPVERRAADFVSGMTDRYAIRLAANLGCDDARSFPL